MIDDVKSTEKSPGESEEPKLNQTDNQEKTNLKSSLTPDLVIDEASIDKEGTIKAKKNFRLKFKWPPSKREWLVSLVVVLCCGGIVAFVINHTGQKPIAHAAVMTSAPKITKPVSDLVPSTLSGLPVLPSVNKQPVTGVMIENSDFARPQSGLSQAEVVFEAIAEGGITRFLALYQDTAPSNVGPIRSVRPYYEQWALGFDASIAHVGGSPEALADIKSWNVKDLDEFYNGSYYHRITTREAPHNVYTSLALLNQLEAKKGYTTTNFTGFPRKTPAPSKTPTAATINLTLSGADYAVSYAYDAASNSYNRSEGGAPQIDANTNAQLSPKVVIAMVVPYSLEADGYHSDYGVIGSGAVDIFQDGTVSKGTWTKTSSASQISFKDSNNKTIELDPGQTWITAIAVAGDVSYTP